jgi:hypothetical protein
VPSLRSCCELLQDGAECDVLLPRNGLQEGAERGVWPPRNGFMKCCRMVPSRISCRVLLQDGAEPDVLPPRIEFVECCTMLLSLMSCRCCCKMVLSLMSCRYTVASWSAANADQPNVSPLSATEWC